MLSLVNRLLDWLRSLFWKEEMELTLVGLQYSGKTTFVNVIAVNYNAALFLPLSRLINPYGLWLCIVGDKELVQTVLSVANWVQGTPKCILLSQNNVFVSFCQPFQIDMGGRESFISWLFD